MNIREKVFSKGWESVIDVVIPSVMYLLWEKFGLAVALPIFIFFLIIVAPSIGQTRLSLIAITFLSFSIEVAKERKFEEAFIFISVVTLSILIDETIRHLRSGASKFNGLTLPKSPLLADICFGFLGAGGIYIYSIYQYSTGGASFFAYIGEAISLAINSREFIINPILIIILGILPGVTLSALIRGKDNIFALIIINPLRCVFLGLFCALIVFVILQPSEFLVLLLLKQIFSSISIDANNVFLVPNFLLIHLIFAMTASPTTLEKGNW